jgi:hypothetical protein
MSTLPILKACLIVKTKQRKNTGPLVKQSKIEDDMGHDFNRKTFATQLNFSVIKTCLRMDAVLYHMPSSNIGLDVIGLDVKKYKPVGKGDVIGPDVKLEPLLADNATQYRPSVDAFQTKNEINLCWNP